MTDYSNAYLDTDDNAQQIIANIMTKINLSRNITDNPFTSSDQTTKEVIGVLNSLIIDLSKESEFTQIKHRCSFKTYKTYTINETVAVNESRISNNLRYLCTNGGVSNITPLNTTENVEFTMDNTALWEVGLTISEGAYINSGKLLYRATTSGITGPNAPTGTSTTIAVNDGGVEWLYVSSICYWINKGDNLNEYPFSEICPNFRSLCAGTIINKTNTRVLKPLTDQQAQNLNVYNITTPSNFYQIRERAIQLYPTYGEDTTIEFYYYGKKLIQDEDGVYKKYFTANSDIPVIPSQVLIYGACYKWEALKKMDFTDNYNTFQNSLKKALGENKEPVIVNLDGNSNDNYSPVPFQDWVIGQ